MHGYSILFISSFYVPSVKNNFGTTGLTEAGKAKAWESKISTYNVLTIFSTFLINLQTDIKFKYNYKEI